VDLGAPLDPERILEALAEHSVEYVIVGGLAVQTHGHVRTTVDIDLFPWPVPSNLARLADALNALDARVLNPGSEGLTIDAAMLPRAAARPTLRTSRRSPSPIPALIGDRRCGRRDLNPHGLAPTGS
jgi:hypothetical protein